MKKVKHYFMVILSLTFILSDVKAQWMRVNLPDTLNYPTMIDAYDSTLEVFASDGQYSSDYLSNDFGNSWNENALEYFNINNYASQSSKFFKLIDNHYYLSCYLKPDSIWKKIYASTFYSDMVFLDSILIASEYSSPYTDGGIRYINSKNEAIFTSGNYNKWSRSLNNISCISLTSIGNEIFVGSANGVFSSTDFGKSWIQKGFQYQTVTKIIAFDTILVAFLRTNYGELYKSFDKGNNWNRFSPGMINILDIELCNDQLIMLTFDNDYYTHKDSKIWRRSFLEVVTGVKKEEDSPTEFSLFQNYPNPFNPNTIITYSVKEEGLVSIKVFNILGQEISTIVNEIKEAGIYNVNFNAPNLTSGTYIYLMLANNFCEIKKMLIVK